MQQLNNQLPIIRKGQSECLYRKMSNADVIISDDRTASPHHKHSQTPSSFVWATKLNTFYFSPRQLKPAHQLYQSIIIMSDTHPHPPLVLPLSAPPPPHASNSGPHTPPSTDSNEQHQKIMEQTSRRVNYAWLEWKKEIKHYFKATRKIDMQAHNKDKENWLLIALKILDFGPKAKKQQNLATLKKKIQSKDNINSKIIPIINKTPKTQPFLIFILTHRMAGPLQQQIYYDVELLCKTSRILYKKINLKKWQDIHREIDRAKGQTTNLILMLQNKQSLMSHLERNKEMLRLVEGFRGIEETTVKQEDEPTQKSICKIQDITDGPLIYQAIERFQYIRKALLHSLQKYTYSTLTLDEALALSIAYNIISLLPLSMHQALGPQMKPYYANILRTMNREHDKQQRRTKSVAFNNDHFPLHLENAQNCWRCKKKRGYVCCSTCSRSQGKNISLCLNCYASHHSQLSNTVVSHSQQEATTIYQQWMALNLQVQAMMPELAPASIVKIEPSL